MKKPRLLQFAVLAVMVAPALAQEAKPDHLALGKMWTFENPPLAYFEQEYGFKPDQKWLDGLRLAALRLGEGENAFCSASFVSPKGLIMTNHHCVREQVARIQGEHDWIKDGYAAKSLEDEVKVPGLNVQQLISQEDVTAKVNEGVAAGDDDVTVSKKRDENVAKIKKAADEAKPGFTHQVVQLFQGAVVELYTYKVYDDLRLVLAPNLQTAYFGGDPDNFTYPRYDVDFSFVRAYEDDKPADTAANYFRWRQEGVKDGELVFVPGNPGNTNRLFTEAQLEYQRDVEYPIGLEELKRGIAIVRPFAARNDQILATVLNWENSFKAIGGMLEGLKNKELMQLKQTHEAQFKAAVMADPKLKEKYGKIWETLARLAQQKRETQPRTHFYQAGYSSVLERGLAIARATDDSLPADVRERAKAEALGMQMQPLNQITGSLLADSIERAKNWLPKDDPFLVALLGDKDVPTAIKKLAGSKLTKAKFAKELLDGGAEAVKQSDDLGVVVARTMWPLQRDNEKRATEVDSAMKVQGTLIGQALHDVYGNSVSPDATMTLRFSDGVVKGYPYNGTLAPFATSFYGMFGRSVEFGGKEPFDLPEPWLAAKDKIDLTKKVCFVSTNDIVGGNSGSCLVDKDLQVIGLIFDGNIESLPNDFYFTQNIARAVSTHTDAIMVAITQVYGLQRLADELLGTKLPGGEAGDAKADKAKEPVHAGGK